MEKKRIEYIDLMKGICIILVVLGHTNLISWYENNWDFLINCKTGRMPLYFALSGLFFKRYGSFFEFFRRRVRQLVIPILVFGPLGAFIMFCIPWTSHSIDYITNPVRLFASLTTFTNTPLWFLRALFVGSFMMYGLHILMDKGGRWYLLSGALALMAGLAAYFAAPVINSDVMLSKLAFRSGIENAMALLPFLFAGNVISRLGVLSLSRSRRNLCIVAVIFVVSAVVCALVPGSFTQWYNVLLRGSIAKTYFVVCVFSLLIWSFAFLVVRLPYISYIGRYSIVILVFHEPVIMSMHAYELSPAVIFSSLLVAMPLVIYLCVRYIPWACAQPSRKKSEAQGEILGLK